MTATTYASGSFCWNDLATRNAEAAIEFYCAVLGWTPARSDPKEVGVYQRLRAGDCGVAGLYAMHGPRFEGVPPHWQSYLHVDDVDAAARKAAGLGAAILMPPDDVPGVGRMSMLRDPVGATLALVHGLNPPAGVRAEHGVGSFAWNELVTKQPEKATDFYTGFLDWTAKTTDAGDHGYTEWLLQGEPVGGMLHVPGEWSEIPPHWMGYVRVADCDATVGRTRERGGTVLKEPEDIPGVGRFAVLQDPQGAVFSIIRLQRR